MTGEELERARYRLPGRLTHTGDTMEWMDDAIARVRELEAERDEAVEMGRRRQETLDEVRSLLRATVAERDDAVRWIGVVRDELVQAGGAPGDRTVALTNLRALLAEREAVAGALHRAFGNPPAGTLAEAVARLTEHRNSFAADSIAFEAERAALSAEVARLRAQTSRPAMDDKTAESLARMAAILPTPTGEPSR